MSFLVKKIIVLSILGIFILSGIALPMNSWRVRQVSMLSGGKSRQDDFSIMQCQNPQIEKLKIRFEGEVISLNSPIFIAGNRVYLPISEIAQKLAGQVKSPEGSVLLVKIGNVEVKVDTEKNSYITALGEAKLKKKVLKLGQTYYLSVFDLCKIFNWRTDWDTKNKVLSLFRERGRGVSRTANRGTKPALIRLEDFVANPMYTKAQNLEKVRVIVDYLYSESIPFHVAWVPRFVDPRPESKADNDISSQNSLTNADFLFTLDYMNDKNGIIGLHGYTHQYGDSVSVKGYEFHNTPGDGIPSDTDYAEERMNFALESARRLDIPYGFFEAPHYSISLQQLAVAERKFLYIFQNYPGTSDVIVNKKVAGRVVKYVPTPLGYVPGKKDLGKILSRINNPSDIGLASFYLHPFIEFEDIKVIRDKKGYPTYFYSADSALHQLIRAFRANDFKFSTIFEAAELGPQRAI